MAADQIVMGYPHLPLFGAANGGKLLYQDLVQGFDFTLHFNWQSGRQDISWCTCFPTVDTERKYGALGGGHTNQTFDYYTQWIWDTPAYVWGPRYGASSGATTNVAWDTDPPRKQRNKAVSVPYVDVYIAGHRKTGLNGPIAYPEDGGLMTIEINDHKTGAVHRIENFKPRQGGALASAFWEDPEIFKDMSPTGIRIELNHRGEVSSVTSFGSAG